MHRLDFGEASVDEDLEMWEELFQFEHPVVFERRNVPVLLRVEALQEGLPCVHDELVDAALLTDSLDEVDDVLPFVDVVDSEPALHGHRNVDFLDAGLTDLGYEVWRVHQLGAEASVDGLRARAPAVQVDFVVAV